MEAAAVAAAAIHQSRGGFSFLAGSARVGLWAGLGPFIGAGGRSVALRRSRACLRRRRLTCSNLLYTTILLFGTLLVDVLLLVCNV